MLCSASMHAASKNASVKACFNLKKSLREGRHVGLKCNTDLLKPNTIGL